MALRKQALPPRSEWRSILNDSELQFFDVWIGTVYRLTGLLDSFQITLPDIPLEEQVTLLMIIRLHDRATAIRGNHSM